MKNTKGDALGNSKTSLNISAKDTKGHLKKPVAASKTPKKPSASSNK